MFRIFLHGLLAGGSPGPEFMRIAEQIDKSFLLDNNALEVPIYATFVLHLIDSDQILLLSVRVQNILTNHVANNQLPEFLRAYCLPQSHIQLLHHITGPKPYIFLLCLNGILGI